MAGITDKEVRSLLSKAKNEGKKLTQVDGTIPGLTLVATTTGVGSWRVRYYIGTKQKETTIGQYPVWGIAEARTKAKEWFCRVNVASMPCGVSFPDCTSPGRN